MISARLWQFFPAHRSLVVACSGGFDSLLLAFLLALDPKNRERLHILHIHYPYVHSDALARLQLLSERENWQLAILYPDLSELAFTTSNPDNRCYFCKQDMFSRIFTWSTQTFGDSQSLLASGTNSDDLEQWRPGRAAELEADILTPFATLGFRKEELRLLARQHHFPWPDLPAETCLATRIYSGLSITPERLQAVAFAESWLRQRLPVSLLRCRFVNAETLEIEIPLSELPFLEQVVIQEMEKKVVSLFPFCRHIRIQPEGYRMGKAMRR